MTAGHESRYGPGWTVSSASGGNDGGNCAHLARVSNDLRAQRAKEGLPPLLSTTTHVVRDEHGGELELTTNEAWAWVRGAKAGDFDHLFDTPPVADLSTPQEDTGTPVEGWPDRHVLEAAFGLLCSAQPHEVLNPEKALEWSREFDRWRDAYNKIAGERSAAAAPLEHLNVIVGNSRTLDENQTARVRGVLFDALGGGDREWSCSA